MVNDGKTSSLWIFSATGARTALIFGLFLDTIAMLVGVWTHDSHELVTIPLSNCLGLSALAFCAPPYLFLNARWKERIGMALAGFVIWLAYTLAIAILLLLSGAISWLD